MMAKAKFKIENKIDGAHIHDWMKRQFTDVNFLDHSEDAWQAKKDFKKIKWDDFDELNTFCEKYLKKSDWKRLKGALRSVRYRAAKNYGSSDDDGIRRVDLNNKAHRILKKLSMHYGVTLSGVIIEYMENAFWELPDEEDE